MQQQVLAGSFTAQQTSTLVVRSSCRRLQDCYVSICTKTSTLISEKGDLLLVAICREQMTETLSEICSPFNVMC
jgi:hypothetical protein